MAYSDFCSPVVGFFRITSPFGQRTNPITGTGTVNHSGLDIAAPEGTQIFAIDDGEVVELRKAFEGSNAGEFVTLRHQGNDGIYFSRYLHLYNGSTNHISLGQSVEKGQEIGKLGNTGRSTGAHLHFELTDQDRNPFDPLGFINQTSGQQDETNKEGFYRSNSSDDPPEPLPFIDPDTLPPVPSFSNISTEPSEDTISKEDVEDSALAFFLSDIIQKKKVTDTAERISFQNQYISETEYSEQSIDYEEINQQSLAYDPYQSLEIPIGTQPASNIIFLNGEENTSYLHNLIFSKGFGKKGKDFSTITTLELSNMVPYVELYAVKRLDDGNQIEVSFPFDDYTNKQNLESILQDKTSRGGSIGISDVEWKTLATNPSNLAQISLQIKFYIQDIKDIETRRNNISLLDFLYPAGSRSKDDYDPSNFNIKLKVGWAYKKESNITLSEIEQKITKQELSESIYATLYKHEFEFLEDGGVELTGTYIGMIESEINHINTYNILDKLNPQKKVKENLVNAWKKILKELEAWGPESVSTLSSDRLTRSIISEKNESIISQLSWWQKVLVSVADPYAAKSAAITYDYITINNLPDGSTATIYIDEDDKEGTREKAKEILKEAIVQYEEELIDSYKDGFSNLLEQLAENGNIHYLYIPEEQVRVLQKISQLPKDIDYYQLEDLRESLTYIKQNIREEANNIEPETINEAFDTQQELGFTDTVLGDVRELFNINQFPPSDKRHINSQEFIDNITTNLGNSTQDSIIPYTFLGDIISYFVKLFFEEKDIPTNSDLRIVLGSFSYRDIGSLDYEKNVYLGASTTNDATNLFGDGVLYKKLSTKKKYANLSDIPISLKSMVSWYNTKILDADLTKMSFHSFLKNLVNDLVASNLASNIVPYISNRNIITSFNYLTVPFDNEIEQELENNKKITGKYSIDFTGRKYQNSNFFKLRQKQVGNQEKTTIKERKVNYMFILSTNERSTQLKGEYSPDLDKSIYHFYTGEDKGLVKKIKFKKDDNKQLDATNILRVNNGQAESAIIRRIYHLDLEMFGNTIFEPGMLFHVSPTFPGARLQSPVLYDIGLGGYYRAYEISSYINKEEFGTQIKAHWQLSGKDETKEEDEIFRVRGID